MAWSASAVFVQTVQTIFMKQGTAPTNYVSLTSDSIKCALYSSNTITPSNTDTLAHSAYNAAGSPWVTGGEVSSSNYTAGGSVLASTSSTVSSNLVQFTSTGPSWTSVSFTAYGDLVYDHTITGGTVADQGICFNYFGGAQTVTSGTFTISWNANGIFNFQV